MPGRLSLFLSPFVRPHETLQAVHSEALKLRYGVLSQVLCRLFAVGKQKSSHLQRVPSEPLSCLRVPVDKAWLYSFYPPPNLRVQPHAFRTHS